MTYLPKGATGQESRLGWVEAAPLSRYIFDRVIREMWHLPNVTAAADLTSQGAGTPSLVEINSSEICGLTTDADNESYSHLWVLPIDIDLTGAIDFRVLWSNSEAAATGTALWVIKYTALTAGTTAMAVGATALDTAITADADLAANVVQWSPWGSISASKTGVVTLTPGDDALAIKTYVDVTTIADATAYEEQVRFYRKYIA